MFEKVSGQPIQQLRAAYILMNDRLFSASLPGCELRFSTRPGSEGHYQPATVVGRHDAGLDLICVSASQSVQKIFESLAHQMCHQYRQYRGNPPRRAYHDQAWAKKMIEIGLQPSDTAAPGGRTTGQRMSHYLLECSPLSELIKELVSQGHDLSLLVEGLSTRSNGEILQQKGTKPWSRTKYACPACGRSVLGGDRLNLICGDCNRLYVPTPPTDCETTESPTDAERVDPIAMRRNETCAMAQLLTSQGV